MEKKVKVYLRNNFHGEVTATDANGNFAVLKVFSEVHEATGQTLAHFVVASLSERDSLWGSGLACSREAAMGLLMPEMSKGAGTPTYDDPVPESHKVADNIELMDDPRGASENIVEDPAESATGYEDEFADLDAEEIVITRESAPNDMPAPSVMSPPPEKAPTEKAIEDVVALSAPVRASLRKANLMSVADVVALSINDLEAVPGVGKTTASKLYNSMADFRTEK